MDKERRCQQHSDGGAQQEDAVRHSDVGVSEPSNLEGHQLGKTEAAQEELPHSTQEPGEETGQPQPHEESCEAPGELIPQGGKYKGSPRVGGSDCSGRQQQEDVATESGVLPGTHVPGDRSVGGSGRADTVPDEHPEGNIVLLDPGNHNSKSMELWMVADGSLLGCPITGGSGTCAMGNGQEARRW